MLSLLEERSTVPQAHERLPASKFGPGPLHPLFSFPDTHRDSPLPSRLGPGVPP